jgi:PAS domain S-box-containing protein
MKLPFHAIEDKNEVSILALETLPAKVFDELMELASLICQTPVAFAILIDGSGGFFQSGFGLKSKDLIKSKSLCELTLSHSGEYLSVPNMRGDKRFHSHPLVAQENGYVFFTGIPLKFNGGKVKGALCVMDNSPREIQASQLEALKKLANQFVTFSENRLDKMLLQKSKKELEQEHLRLQNIIDATEVGTWEWNIKSGKLSYSSGWAAMLGYSLDELGPITRRTRRHIIHPQDLVASNQQLDDYLQQKSKIYQCEVRMRHKDGHWVWVLDRGQVMSWDENGKPEVMFGTHTDISEQVHAKERLGTRERRFRALIENSDDAFAILDLNGKATYVSASISRVLGYSEQEALELNLFDITHPDDREEIGNHFKKSLQQPGIPIAGHTGRILHKDGTWRWLSSNITCMLHDPVINGIIDNFKDVTEEVIAEQKLVQSERRFKKLVLEGADLIAIVDTAGTYLYLSPNHQSYLGMEVEALLGQDAFSFIHPDDKKLLREEFYSIAEVRQIKFTPYRFRFQENEWKWMQTMATNLTDDPDIGGIVINSVDISENVDVQNQLELANKRFDLILRAGSESIYDYNPVTREIFLSEDFRENLGLQIKSDFENFDTIYESLHPLDRERAVNEFLEALEDPSRQVWEREYRLRKGSGEYAYIRDRSIRLTDSDGKTIRVVGAMRDISHEFISQKLDEYEKELIERSLVEEVNEQEIYADFLLRIESLIPNMRGSILKIIDGKLSNFASPSLDPKVISAIEGLPIGVGQGSCGTAAFLNQPILVQDALLDPYWEKYRDLATDYGIGACWSFPIVNNKGQVVATIANYFSEKKIAPGIELSVLERAHRILGIVMAKFNYLEKIRKDNERYEIVNKSTRDAIFDWDVQRDIFSLGDSFRRSFGHDFSQESFKLKDWVALTHPADRGIKDDLWEIFITQPNQDKWENQFRLLKSDGTYAFVEEQAYMVRDVEGLPIRMVGVLRDRTEHFTIQLLKNIQEKISNHFKSEEPLEEILKNLLGELTDIGDFQVGEIWLSTEENTHLALAASAGIWRENRLYSRDSHLLELLFAKKGLPGKLWECNDVIFWNQLTQTKDFLRKEWAFNYDLIAAVGIPFISGEEILGACLLFSKELISEKNTSFRILHELVPFIGRELRRKQQEEELKLFFTFSPDILAISSPKGYFTKVNPAFCQLLGYEDEELTFVPFTNFLHPDDLSNTENEFDEASGARRLAENYVNRYRTKSGEYRYISWNSSDVFGPDKLVFAYGRDVTEFKKIEELLKNASLMARVGGWEVDLLRGIHNWSQVTREIHEVDELPMKDMDASFNYYREDFREMVTQEVNQAIAKGSKFDFEAVIVTAKGNERWVRAIGEAEQVEGKTIRIFGSIQDIHENKIMEERLRGVSDNVPGVIFQYKVKPDGSDELSYVSRGSQLIWELSPEECMMDSTRIWSQVAAAGDRNALQRSIQSSAVSLEKWNFEWRALSLDGQIRWHHGMGTPSRKSDGSVVWDSLVMDVTERKKLENLLDQSARLAKIGSWEIDTRVRPHFLEWNGTTADILETEQRGILLQEALQVYADQFRKIATDVMHQLLEEGMSFDQEILLTTAKGNQKWIRCLGQAQVLDGKVIRAFGSFQDIHDRKVTELEFKELFQERNSILESIGDGFFALDRLWTVTYWNNQAEKLLNVDKDSILGRNLWEVFDQESNTLSFVNYHRAVETGEMIHFEEYYEKLNLCFSISAFPSDSGLTVYFKDITTAKESEKLLSESNERFEKVAEATNDAIWDFQIETGKVFFGKGFQTLFGHPLDLAKPRIEMLHGFIHPEDKERVMKKMISSQNDPSINAWNDEYRFQKADSTYAYVINRATFIRNKKGKLLRTIGAITDISDRKNYEESLKILNQNLEQQAKELATSNLELEHFAYVASHDLQEPLRMVSSFLSQLERKYKDDLDEKAQQYIHFAVDGAKRMRKIILDLLEFSRVGKDKEENEQVDMKELVHEVIDLHKKIMEENGGEIQYEGLKHIVCYRTPVFQIVQNLIGNGLKYSRKGLSPKILVKAEDLGDAWQISVQDNGLGIKEEYFDKIFVIFQRLHRKDEYQGTGMGLAIVKKIVEGLGGSVWLESVYGQGSTFYFTIPKSGK